MAGKSVVVLPGDGIGPEVISAAVKVCDAALKDGGCRIDWHQELVGGASIDACGVALPDAALEACRRADAVLLGAVGGPRWEDPKTRVRPEQGLLALRQGLGLYANLRPVKMSASLHDASPLKADRVAGVDILFVRELVGGLYFGDKERTDEMALDVCRYTVEEIERVVRVACRAAMGRARRLTSVDKANVLETSRLWRETTSRLVAEEFPEIELEHLLVDAMAMHLLSRPKDFSVVVTENLFGDILTDEASMIPGSLGMLPSASLGEGSFGLYEPVHGSAPDIAGSGAANPLAAILSTALMLRHSLDCADEAAAIECAIESAVARGILPADLCRSGQTPASTAEVTQAVLDGLG